MIFAFFFTCLNSPSHELLTINFGAYSIRGIQSYIDICSETLCDLSQCTMIVWMQQTLLTELCTSKSTWTKKLSYRVEKRLWGLPSAFPSHVQILHRMYSCSLLKSILDQWACHLQKASMSAFSVYCAQYSWWTKVNKSLSCYHPGWQSCTWEKGLIKQVNRYYGLALAFTTCRWVSYQIKNDLPRRELSTNWVPSLTFNNCLAYGRSYRL